MGLHCIKVLRLFLHRLGDMAQKAGKIYVRIISKRLCKVQLFSQDGKINQNLFYTLNPQNIE